MPRTDRPTLAPMAEALELRPALNRPPAMTLDSERCIECGACEDLAPGLLERPERITITPATLEAMTVCPVGAIHWLEGEDPHDDAHRNA